MVFGLFFTQGCFDRSTIEFSDQELVPLRITLADLRSSVEVTEPKEIMSPVKVELHQNLMLVMEKFTGIHMIDNSDSTAPVKLNFITIPGITYFEIKSDHVFAASGPDLVIFNIQDPSAPRMVKRLENEFRLNFQALDGNGVVIGFETREFINRRIESHSVFGSGRIFDETTPLSFQINEPRLHTGVVPRFTISNDHLYTTSEFSIRVLDVSDPKKTQPVASSTDQFFFFNNEVLLSGSGELITVSSNGNAFWHLIANPINPQLTTTNFDFLECSQLDMLESRVVSAVMEGGFCNHSTPFLTHHELDPVRGIIRRSNSRLDHPCSVVKILEEDVIVGFGGNGVSIFEFEEFIGEEWFTSGKMNVTAADGRGDLFVLAGSDGVRQFIRSDKTLTPVSTIR
jgi:hypothetical protein